MKTLIILLCLLAAVVHAQSPASNTLTLDECYTRSAENYPVVKQRELITKAKDYAVSNAGKARLPVITINGQQTYQSAVTEIPIQLPEMDIPTLSKNQYKIYGELMLNLYDGGNVKHRKQSHEVNALVEEQKVEVELYRLRERINQLFFGILFIDAQLAQNELLQNDIQIGIQKAEAAIANGTILKSHLDVLRAELLRTQQRSTELQASREAYLGMLGLLTGEVLDENTVLVKPEPLVTSQEINRPELSGYDYQKKAIDVQEKILTACNLPKISSFLQVGAGRPALNMLSNEFESYYIGGIRLTWTLSGFYTYKNEKALLELNRKNLDIQKETFVFNTRYALNQQQSEVRKFQTLLSTDEDIIGLRTQIKNSAAAQLQNGVINSNDYLREVNAEDQARQNKILHEIQWLMAQYNEQTTAGN